MTTFFQKLRKLGDSNKEDYLTEIFAFALQNDSIFWNNFLKLLSKELGEQNPPFIKTQVHYQNEKRRPDIEIDIGNIFIIIECKLGAEEGDEQLDDYAEILSAKVGYDKKMLIYLTLKHDKKSKEYKGIVFKQLRWFDIASTITDKCDLVTKELKQYLFKEKIVMEKFGYEDIVSFKMFIDTAQKMNDILNETSKEVKDKKLHKYNNFRPALEYKEYIIRFVFNDKCDLCFGFGYWWNEHPRLLVRLYIPLANAKTVAEDIKCKLNNEKWNSVPNRSGYIVETSKELAEVLLYDEITQRKKIIDFFFESIKSLKGIKSDFPQVFGKEFE